VQLKIKKQYPKNLRQTIYPEIYNNKWSVYVFEKRNRGERGDNVWV
jgi:hypothetical protein